MHRFLRQFPSILAVLVAGLLAACSRGGGSGGGAGVARNLDLFVNTGAESEALITGRLAVVALETEDHRLTPNLVEEGVEITLADPFGELSGVPLRDAPPGTYVAVNILFLAAEVTAVLPDGQVVPVLLPQRDFRLPLSRPLELTAGPQSWFTLHHDGPVVLERTPEGLRWTPNWVADTADVELVRGVVVRVVAFDAARFQVDGQLVHLSDLAAVLDLSGAETLRRDERVLDRAQFFAELKAGELMWVDGWLDRWRNIRVIAAHVDTDDDHGRPKSEVRGEIVELLARETAFVLRVHSVRKDRAGLPGERPLHLTVDVGERSRIKWVPRHGRHRGHLPYDALQVGMLVDVEWHGAAPDRRLTAHKVDIHGERRTGQACTVRGEVRAVEPARVLLAPRGRAEFRLGGARYPVLPVQVDEDTVIVRRTRGEHQVIALHEVPVGSPVHVAVERCDAEPVRAVLVRVE